MVEHNMSVIASTDAYASAPQSDAKESVVIASDRRERGNLLLNQIASSHKTLLAMTSRELLRKNFFAGGKSE